MCKLAGTEATTEYQYNAASAVAPVVPPVRAAPPLLRHSRKAALGERINKEATGRYFLALFFFISFFTWADVSTAGVRSLTVGGEAYVNALQRPWSLQELEDILEFLHLRFRRQVELKGQMPAAKSRR